MGAEFLERTRKSYRKHVDRKRVDLSTPDLLTCEPRNKPRSVVFKMSEGTNFASGDTLIVEPFKDIVVARRDVGEVARASNATPSLAKTIEKGGGAALGTVRKINPLSRTIEVELS